jgi:two-component system chemotaxis sensor kinase CheA
MGDFEEELKQGFLEEASQLLADTEQCFLLIEANPEDRATVEKIFRLAHNIKGSSRAVGFESLGAFTHEFESFLIRCKGGEVPIDGRSVSLLLKCNDHINQFIQALKADLNASLDSIEIMAELRNYTVEAAPSPAPPVAAKSEPMAQPINDGFESSEPPAGEAAPRSEAVTAAKAAFEGEEEEESFGAHEVAMLNASLLRADEGSALPLATEAPSPTGGFESSDPLNENSAAEPVLHAAPAEPAPADHGHAVKPAASGPQTKAKAPAAPSQAPEESIRVSISRLEKLVNFVGEMVILETVLKEQSYGNNPQLLRRTVQQMGKVTKEVQELSMSLRMVPLRQTFQKMQRIVRDTSGVLAKKVQLSLAGEETEVDKLVLEALSDPLVHLIRNAVDHGIEMPAERVAAGKSEVGALTLAAYHQGGRLVIEVKDDGGGIPADRLRKKAVEKGILKPGQVISDKEAIALIFHPGFSTKAEVTEVSGRGVGMDVVKSNIERMQGEVRVDTVLHKGSTFKIILPLTLAIIDGMVVRCGDERFILPLTHVHESVKARPSDLHMATGIGEVLLLRGENLPVIRLGSALGRKPKKGPDTGHIAIIVRSQGSPFAALVDDIIGQHQVVIKKLGTELQHLPGFSGSAILGDGRPALILELANLTATKNSLQTRNSA